MDFNETFENIKNKVSAVAQSGASKAKNLAQTAKANLDIRAEQDKQKKAYLELGKLFYRDFITGEESDEAEYLPWCDKITESVKKIDELRTMIDDMKSGDAPADAEVCDAEPCEETAGESKVAEFVEAAKEKAEEAAEEIRDCAEDIKEDLCECAEEIKPEE